MEGGIGGPSTTQHKRWILLRKYTAYFAPHFTLVNYLFMIYE